MIPSVGSISTTNVFHFIEALGVQQLRRDLPHWTWVALHRGFGWWYQGTYGKRTAMVYPCAMLTGIEDVYRTVWMVCEEKTDTQFALWYWTAKEGA